MIKDKVYFAAFSPIGIGVYTNRKKLLCDKRFMGKAEFKKFNDFEMAVEYTISEYNRKYKASSGTDRTCYLDTLEPNWWYFSKNF